MPVRPPGSQMPHCLQQKDIHRCGERRQIVGEQPGVHAKPDGRDGARHNQETHSAIAKNPWQHRQWGEECSPVKEENDRAQFLRRSRDEAGQCPGVQEVAQFPFGVKLVHDPMPIHRLLPGRLPQEYPCRRVSGAVHFVGEIQRVTENAVVVPNHGTGRQGQQRNGRNGPAQ